MAMHFFRDSYDFTRPLPGDWPRPGRPRVQIAVGMYRDGVPIVLVEGGHAQLRRCGAHGFAITIYFDEGLIYDWGTAEIRYSRPTGFVHNTR